MHVDPLLIGSVWAVRLLAFALIVGAIPLASVGLALSAWTGRSGYRWQPAWHLAFQAGFVIQICGLVPTVPMWLLLLLSSGLSGSTGWDILVLLILSASVAGGCFALGAWRRLMAATVQERPPSILA